MNILLITQLYPLIKDSENSFALHYFVKEWIKEHHVQVLRPYLPMETEKLPERDQIMLDDIKIDIIKPKWIPILKISIINKPEILARISKKPDVIICHLYNSYLTFSFLKEYYKVPFVVGIHRSDVLLARNILYRKRLKKIIEKAELIVYRSLAVKRNFEKYIIPKNDVFIAWSGIPEFLVEKARHLLKTGKERGETKRFISVCRLLKLKQIDKVIFALNELKATGYKWEYTIIGDGPEKSKLENLTRKLGLESQISFKGKILRQEVFDYMEKNEFFIMPSYNETFGLVYLEAMANGCIVIGSKGWGIDGIIEDATNGYLCDPYSQDSINQVVRKVVSLREDELDTLTGKSFETVIYLSENQMAKKYLQSIKENYVRN